jgi:hypothetical protein
MDKAKVYQDKVSILFSRFKVFGFAIWDSLVCGILKRFDLVMNPESFGL